MYHFSIALCLEKVIGLCAQTIYWTLLIGGDFGNTEIVFWLIVDANVNAVECTTGTHVDLSGEPKSQVNCPVG